MANLRSAIPPDEILDKELGELSAADFLSALASPVLHPRELAVLPDKKKWELWIDEGGIPKLKVGELLERVRLEKKKLELEKHYLESAKLPREQAFDLMDIVRDPAFIDHVAERVAARMKQ